MDKGHQFSNFHEVEFQIDTIDQDSAKFANFIEVALNVGSVIDN